MNLIAGFPHISNTVDADNTAKFMGDVFIGENCKIEKDVVIDGTKGRVKIGSNCEIGESVVIYSQGSKITIGDKAVIKKGSVIAQSIGEGAIIEASTKLI